MELLVLLCVWLAAAFAYSFTKWRRAARADFVRRYMFPPRLFDKLLARRPGWSVKEQQRVARTLRHVFLADLRGGRKRVAMPSQVVDDLWHEFILYTRNYERFCGDAFGGFLHHTPAVLRGDSREDDAGLCRVWWFAQGASASPARSRRRSSGRMRRRTRPPCAGAHKGCADNVSRPEGPVPKGCAGIERWRCCSACRYPDIDGTSRLAIDRYRLQRDPRRPCRGSLEENIDPRKPTRLPLLFASDGKLGIANGSVYTLDCSSQPSTASGGTRCTRALSNCGTGGNPVGDSAFGDSGGSWFGGGDSSGGDSGGCSGGCGGGGGD